MPTKQKPKRNLNAELAEALKWRDEYKRRTGKLFEHGKSCALGAGYEAVAGDMNTALSTAQELLDMFPYLEQKRQVICPVGCGSDSGDIAGGITHLNDEHQWTREAVAEWLYEQEELLGFVTVVETEALNVPEAGRGDSVVTEAQAGVLTGRF